MKDFMHTRLDNRQFSEDDIKGFIKDYNINEGKGDYMNKKSIIFSLITCCSLLFSTSCSNNSQSQVTDELVVRYENYVSNGGELTYDEWLKVIEDPELNNENYDAPYIGSNGNWYVNGLDTGVKASGDDGSSITIVNTSLEVDGNVTYTKIEFSDGSIIKIPNGKDG